MKFNELSNEELVFIYLLIEDLHEGIEEVLKDGGMTHEMDSPFGRIKLFAPFSDKELEDLNESPKVVLARSIRKKLEPVFNLISEADREVIDKVRESLFPKDLDDETEEEDM